MDTNKWQMVAVPKKLWDKVKDEVKRKKFWSSPSEYVRDAIKQKLYILNFVFRACNPHIL